MSDTQHQCVKCPFADETSRIGYQARRAIDMPRRRVVQAEKTMLGLVFEACIALVVECCVFGIWHCIVDQATGVGCEEILREASASRSANSQVTQSPHAIPAAKAPLGCALCPVTSSPEFPTSIPIHPPVCVRGPQRKSTHFSIQVFGIAALLCREGSSQSVGPSPE